MGLFSNIPLFVRSASQDCCAASETASTNTPRNLATRVRMSAGEWLRATR